MPLRYFVSYRRDDSQGVAGRFFDRLVQRYGEGSVLIDVDRVRLGHDYGVAIEQAVESADVFIVLISPHWVEATDEAGHRRLDDPDDVVLLEVGSALNRGMAVIPVLVDDARMPRRTELPDAIAGLARRSPVRISHASFHPDVTRFLDDLDEIQFRDDVPPAATQPKVDPSPPRPQQPEPAAPGSLDLFLDLVRNKRFRMARKSGYEVLEVDEFVDEIERALVERLQAWHSLSRGERPDERFMRIEEVQQKRFRMARKSGYEVLEVDEFVDEVEEEFARQDQLFAAAEGGQRA